MKHYKLFINNPVSLHFYSTEERLPDDFMEKIVIVRTNSMGDLVFLSRYDNSRKIWTYSHEDMEEYFSNHVIAWASFSPDWVVSESDRDIFGCK